MSHAYVFWIEENMGDIIPIRDLKLTPQQMKIKEEAGGLGHVVGTTLKARYGEKYFEAKVLKIGSSKELSEVEDILFTAEYKEKNDVSKKRRSRPPNRYGGLKDESSDGDDEYPEILANNKRRLEHLKSVHEVKNYNQRSSFLSIINNYDALKQNSEEKELKDDTITDICMDNIPSHSVLEAPSQSLENELKRTNEVNEAEVISMNTEMKSNETLSQQTYSVLADANRVLNAEDNHNMPIYYDMDCNQQQDKENCAPEMQTYENYSHSELVEEINKLNSRNSHSELVEEINKLNSRIKYLESQGCSKCFKQKPPPSVQQYFKLLMDEAVISETEGVCSTPVRATNKVPLMDGYNVLVTKAQKVTILVEGRRNPQILVSKFLYTFFSEEELGRLSYNGKKENGALPLELKECLSGLLLKHHPQFLGVAKVVNRICCNARYRWRGKSGQSRPGDESKYTPKRKRQSITVNEI